MDKDNEERERNFVKLVHLVGGNEPVTPRLYRPPFRKAEILEEGDVPATSSPSRRKTGPSGNCPWRPEKENTPKRANNVYLHPDTLKAVKEGRYLHIGNISWDAAIEDIECIFEGLGLKLKKIEPMHEPERGGPFYTFIETFTKEQANTIIDKYQGKILFGRPMKIKYGQPPGMFMINSPTGYKQAPKTPKTPKSAAPFGQSAFFDKFQDFSEPKHPEEPDLNDPTKLHIGGLPVDDMYGDSHELIREFFQGFNLESHTDIQCTEDPRILKYTCPGYAYVKMYTVEDAEDAVRILNGRRCEWGTVYVDHACDVEPYKGPREALEEYLDTTFEKSVHGCYPPKFREQSETADGRGRSRTVRPATGSNRFE